MTISVSVFVSESWKKLRAAHGVRADISFRIEDILVQKSRTYVAIEDLCGAFDLFWGEYWGMRIKSIFKGKNEASKLDLRMKWDEMRYNCKFLRISWPQLWGHFTYQKSAFGNFWTFSSSAVSVRYVSIRPHRSNPTLIVSTQVFLWWMGRGGNLVANSKLFLFFFRLF
jgi:hypothetical protein